MKNIVVKLENPKAFRDLQGDYTYILKGSKEKVYEVFEMIEKRKK